MLVVVSEVWTKATKLWGFKVQNLEIMWTANFMPGQYILTREDIFAGYDILSALNWTTFVPVKPPNAILKVKFSNNVKMCSQFLNKFSIFKFGCLYLFVYQKGDLVKQPMKKGSFVPKNVPGVGWGGVCHGGVGWCVSWSGVCHGGVGWVIYRAT